MVIQGTLANWFIDWFVQMAAEIAVPLSATKKITMVQSGEGEVGAAKLTSEVLTIMTQVPDMVKALTGVDMAKV